MALLEMSEVTKRFGGVCALSDASLTVDEGEIHGLLGPNGSGKSTLNKVLAGTVSPDHARIRIAGHDVRITCPMDANRHGTAAVHQQLSVVPHLDIGQNLVLGLEESRWGFLRTRGTSDRVDEVFDLIAPGLGVGVHLNTSVSALSPGQRQLVEFAKVIGRRPRILVLDEATASLRRDQVELVFDITRGMAEHGTAVVIVSHRMEEIRELCDSATILRGGRTIARVDMASTDDAGLITIMVGRSDVTTVPSTAPDKTTAPCVQVRQLTGAGFRDISFKARPGEVIGLGGLQGQGQSNLLHALFGSQQATSGTVRVDDTEFRPGRPRDAMAVGMALVPGDRDSQGLMGKRSILENLSIASLRARTRPGGLVDMRAERSCANEQVQRLGIKISDLADPVTSLSGGNQQKVVLGKWLVREPRLILLDDPTKGVDVGAKREIYQIIHQLTAAGSVVLLNSSDDEELTAMCHRVLVMFEGRVVRELIGEQITPGNLVEAAIAGRGHGRETRGGH
ncbi:sugar ABC transporter ATP-binding protein [Schaalia sp. 19OD2882]|uniref:sugar ABC transporter ATP-binding protein n=1 Tax=Schaalia sp. 19OD2882 TaxID=2794089 RepID=UPI001C1EE7A8|nr:sugar ABC transporter ATP-binding protein [Schaalia sp. 19OD2882]QWW19591.1 sugar ABC transporter ATP-binding protein [Schaalia sp. 19OD2882]